MEQKICIIGGVRGDDALGVAVLTHYFQHPNTNFQLLLGNYRAIEEKKPWIDFDMLKAGKGDVTCTTSIEKCRAGELHEVLSQYSYAIDVHGSHVQEDCAVVFHDDHQTLAFASALGVQKIFVIPPAQYLLESVPHAVTLIKKVEAKPAPTSAEVSEVILMLERLQVFVHGEVSHVAEVVRLDADRDNFLGKIIDEGISIT